MKIIYNKLIPFPGFIAMNLYGVFFVREECKRLVGERTINHESIHTAQMQDFCKWMPVGGTIYYVLYLLEWLYRLVFHTRTAYEGISFEREAYEHEGEADYLKYRERFAQWKKK